MAKIIDHYSPVNSALGSEIQGSITYQAKVKALYIPRFNKIEDSRTIYDHILKNPLGAWSSLVGGEIEINHVPFLLKENQGDYGTLTCHVSKSNNIWKNIDQGKSSIIAFQGEQSYISPSWYPSKEESGKEVPTWNYTVVHVYGIPKIITDKDWLLNHIDEQTNLYENKLDEPWKISDAPKDFIDRLASAIIGIEIPISKLEGKWKIGQNKSDKDQKGMIRGLVSSRESNSQALGQVLEKGRKA